MFTGIITDVGRVAEIAEQAVGRRLTIRTKYDTSTIVEGASKITPHPRKTRDCDH